MEADNPGLICQRAASLLARGDIEGAGAAYHSAAEAGHAGAQVEFARMLLHGVGTVMDPAQAVQWLLRAEAAGSATAGYQLAVVALGDVALPCDGAIDRRVFAAVNAGVAPARLAAAIHFGRKASVEDQGLCLQLLHAGADDGDALSAALLAERLAVTDPEAALALREQLAARGVLPLPAVSASMPVRDDSPPRQLTLLDALQPAPSTVLSRQPRIAVIDGLLSADECRLLIATSRAMLRASRTTDPDTGLPIALQIRTSSDAAFDPLVEDVALRTVQLRIASAAGMALCQAEQLTVLRYAPGEQYRPHRDDLPPSSIDRDRPQAGNRQRTICVYLNDVEAGGDTEFPAAGVRIAPKAGSAVVFDNLLDDGRPDPDSLHAGLPVERGEKWLATLWLRERRYRAF